MAFIKKLWKARKVEFPNRRKLTEVEVGIVDVERAEGQIYEEGDSFSDTSLNDLEERVDEGFSEIKKTLSDKVIQYTYPHQNMLVPLTNGNRITFIKSVQGKRVKIQGNIRQAIVAGVDTKFVKIPDDSFLPIQTEAVRYIVATVNGTTPILCVFIARRDGYIYVNALQAIPIGKWLAIDETYL